MSGLLSSVLGAATDALSSAATALGVRAEAAAAEQAKPSANAPAFAALLASALAPKPSVRTAESFGTEPSAEEEGTEDEPAAADAVDTGAALNELARVRIDFQGPAIRGQGSGEDNPAGSAKRSVPIDGPRSPIARELDALFEVQEESRTVEAPSARTRGVVRSLGATDPEFRARFERVIERMESEYGHRVEVVETYRTQERQNALYEQGRTQPGPVVTWTRNSNHSQGRAADLLIDGRWDNPQGYARLAEVAREEGLRTLGARDPGHVELLGAGRAPGAFDFAAPLRGDAEPEPFLATQAPMRAARAEGVAQVAAVAQVAPVARVATVAPVTAPVAVPEVTAAAVRGADAGSARGRGRESERERAGSERGAGAHAEAEVGSVGSQAAPTARAGGVPAAPAPAVVAHTDAAARVARVMELQQSGAPRELSHVLLKVDAPDGTQDRIRLDLRGNALDATIDVANISEAGRLSSRVGELQRALAKQGMEAEVVRIRASSAPELTEMARAVAASGEVDTARSSSQSRSGAEQQPGRERGAGHAQRESDSDSPGSRNRSRKEQQGGKDS